MMTTRDDSGWRFAVCIDNREYPVSLELHKIYRVLPDEDAAVDGDLRIIDESGEDYLFPARNFLRIQLPEDAEHTLRDSISRQLSKTA